MKRNSAGLLAALACWGSCVLAAQTGDVVRDLLHSLSTYDQDGRLPGRKVGFDLPESVVNSYLVAAPARPMIAGMTLKFLAGSRCIVDANIDFDALRSREPKLFSESEGKQFQGSKSVRAEFTFSVGSGVLTFEAKPLPSQVTPSPGLLKEIIRVIAAGQPEQIDVTHKIPAPFGLQKLWTTNGMLHGET